MMQNEWDCDKLTTGKVPSGSQWFGRGECSANATFAVLFEEHDLNRYSTKGPLSENDYLFGVKDHKHIHIYICKYIYMYICICTYMYIQY
jgi:hypothetical protein